MNIEILKKILKERKITYAQLSDLSGISIYTIKSIFCGRSKNPTMGTVTAIKRALGLNSNDSDGAISSPYLTQDEERVLRVYRSLDEKRKNYLLTFAEGLKAQSDNK